MRPSRLPLVWAHACSPRSPVIRVPHSQQHVFTDQRRCRESWAPGVQKYRAVCQERGILGTVFLDLYQREGKQQTNAHYTLLCGKRISHDHYRRPVVALACSFSSSRAELSLNEARSPSDPGPAAAFSYNRHKLADERRRPFIQHMHHSLLTMQLRGVP